MKLNKNKQDIVRSAKAAEAGTLTEAAERKKRMELLEMTSWATCNVLPGVQKVAA